MGINLLQDIRPVTELKRHTREILDQVRETQRPMILTTNGRADAVLLNVKVFNQYLNAFKLAKELAIGEADLAAGNNQSAKQFFQEFNLET